MSVRGGIVILVTQEIHTGNFFLVRISRLPFLPSKHLDRRASAVVQGGLSLCLHAGIHTGALLSTQLPKGLGKQEMTQVLGSLPPMWETWMDFLASRFSLAHPQLLSLSLCHYAFQIDKINIQTSKL